MLSQSPLTKVLGQGALLLLVAATATGCGGCTEPSVQCDANGDNCLICDGYGCRPAEPDPGAGGAGQGGAGQGGAGQGGEGGGEALCDPQATTCPCDEDDECADGLRCIEGLCIEACDFSYQCGNDRICVNGQCIVGCDDSTPCTQPGTVCDRGVCVADPANPACSPENPCSEGGQVCVDGLCTTPCATNADCAEGEVCNAATGACIADPSTHPTCATTPCSARGQECMADGYCRYPCDSLARCQRFDARFVACDAGVCKTREEVAPECTVDQPCPDGRDCISNKCL